jgi:hypothetical protein
MEPSASILCWNHLPGPSAGIVDRTHEQKQVVGIKIINLTHLQEPSSGIIDWTHPQEPLSGIIYLLGTSA